MEDVSRLEAEDRAWILPKNGKKTLEAIRAGGWAVIGPRAFLSPGRQFPIPGSFKLS